MISFFWVVHSVPLDIYPIANGRPLLSVDFGCRCCGSSSHLVCFQRKGRTIRRYIQCSCGQNKENLFIPFQIMPWDWNTILRLPEERTQIWQVFILAPSAVGTINQLVFQKKKRWLSLLPGSNSYLRSLAQFIPVARGVRSTPLLSDRK